MLRVKRAGRHFSFIKRAGRHQKGAGRRALQKRPRQNTGISVKGPKLWNDSSADIKLCKSIFTFKKMNKALLLQPYQFVKCLLWNATYKF